MGKNAMQRLNECILEKNSRICAGLDPTWENIPESSKRDNRFGKDQKFSREVSMIKAFRDYCREYIDAICDIVPAIKINSAFFEQYGLEDLYYQLAKESKDKGLFIYNLGTGIGYSVLDIVNAFEKANGIKINYKRIAVMIEVILMREM